MSGFYPASTQSTGGHTIRPPRHMQGTSNELPPQLTVPGHVAPSVSHGVPGTAKSGHVVPASTQIGQSTAGQDHVPDASHTHDTSIGIPAQYTVVGHVLAPPAQ